MSKNLTDTLRSLDPIGLHEMDKVALMNRVDTKFILHSRLLFAVLENLAIGYRVLEIAGSRISGYKNQYFDTKRLKFYTDHHNGKGNRTKVRLREYNNTGICYIEVKQKNNKGRTKKTRKKIGGFQPILSDECIEFVETAATDDLNNKAVLFNRFDRVTLVNKNEQERVTIDFNLSFASNSEEMQYPNLAIIEVKQASLSRNTAIFKYLKSIDIHPYRISKYCLGIASLNGHIKTNLFKEKLRRINKITST
ncbi:MAG: polyphosphate polymerase domain-containing protein [Maribacter sp.]|uniref:polyphosphate polymerase domain-containing protein n=1 Tax=Maribacter sp. TaxID=1897614 RepID=UPI0032980928